MNFVFKKINKKKLTWNKWDNERRKGNREKRQEKNSRRERKHGRGEAEVWKREKNYNSEVMALGIK